ncbi:MBL fold metallo-hydrolase [Aliikangiella coralliicola]|nr:MBL fold metallo-hydrolase [Aliikangiella coralliicola]
MTTSLKISLFLIVTLFSNLSAAQSTNTQKISENVYSIFLNYVQTLVVIGDKGVLITDPANSIRAKQLKKEIAKLTPLPVTDIVLSHEHYDHIGGTEVFPGATIYAQKHAEAVFRLDITGQAPKKVDLLVNEKETIKMGNTKVNLYHYGAADGVAMMALHLPKEKVVFSADLYEANEITNKLWLADSNYLGSRILLNNLVALKPEYAITTHSKSIDPKHLIMGARFYNDLYDAVEAKTLEALSQGFPALVNVMTTLPNQVKLEHFKGFKNYDHLPAHVERMILSIFHGG